MGLPTTDSLITDTVLTALINEAIHTLEYEGEWWWLEGTETLNATVGNSTLTPSSTNYSRTKSLTYTTGQDLDLKDIAFLDILLPSQGPPAFYGFWGNIIHIRPKADTSYSFTHRYLKRELDLASGSDTPLVPDRFTPAIVEYAAYLGYRRSNDGDNAALCLSAYKDWVKRSVANGDLKVTEEGGGVPKGSNQGDDDE